MSASPEAVFSLNKPVTPEALSALRSAGSAAAKAGATRVVLDIDDVGVLDSAVIAGLISILRDVRDHGGDVTLLADRKNILDTLRITALDKVFKVEPCRAPAEPSAVPAPPAPTVRTRIRRASSRFAVLALMALGLATLAGGSVAAEPEWAPDALLQQIALQNPAMNSYEADVSVKLRLQTFPYISERLKGTVYFKRPDFEVVFERVPSYAKGFDKLYSDIEDPQGWARRFDISVAGEREVAGHRDVVLRLVQKVRGMIDHEDVAIDPVESRVDDIRWYYYNGGVISMSQDFQRSGDFNLISAQHITIKVPLVHAAAEARYAGYRTNVPIDDAVFTKDQH